jgi:hypothetical protein
MASYDFDLITLGAGSGGTRASRFSAQVRGSGGGGPDKRGAPRRRRPRGRRVRVSSGVVPQRPGPRSCPRPRPRPPSPQYYGAKVAVVELPFGFVASETVGGAGGT